MGEEQSSVLRGVIYGSANISNCRFWAGGAFDARGPIRSSATSLRPIPRRSGQATGYLYVGHDEAARPPR